MSVLQEGYVVDVAYPTFVHRQAMPVWLSSLVQLQGTQAPDLSKPYRYLELGCAMGIHLHLTAAANPMGTFVGVDFNAQHLSVATEGLAHTNIKNLSFIHASFAELLKQDLEPFDFIVTHGVWSWISPENQDILTQVIHRFLKPNGILYCSYMSHPGATGLTAIQKLMFEMSRNLQGDSASKALQSLAFARKVGQSKVGLFAQMPSLNDSLMELAQEQPNYIAHDFLAEHWQPQHSADMIRRFGQYKMSYVASAGISENIDILHLPKEIQNLVNSLPLVTLQETVKDIARNTLQRQDLYVKDRQRLSPLQQQQVYAHIQFALMPNAPVGKSLKQDAKLGRIYDAIVIFEQILLELNEQPLTLKVLAQRIQHSLHATQLRDLVLMLVWAGYVHPINPKPAGHVTERMNTWMQLQQLPWRAQAVLGTAIDTSQY